MAEGVAEGFGKVVLGGAIGFGLYLLITGLGFGGSGRGEGRGEGRGDAPPPAPSAPAPTRPRDEQRLNFLLSASGSFEPRDVDWKPSTTTKIYTLEELIVRVKEGGRSDVSLKISGAALQGAVDAALAALKKAGIKVWMTEASSPTGSPAARVAGNVRGEYGRRVVAIDGLREARW